MQTHINEESVVVFSLVSVCLFAGCLQPVHRDKPEQRAGSQENIMTNVNFAHRCFGTATLHNT